MFKAMKVTLHQIVLYSNQFIFMFKEKIINLHPVLCSIFGRLEQSGGRQMVKLDFSSVLIQKCAASDYETWKPTTRVLWNEFLLGQKSKGPLHDHLVYCLFVQSVCNALFCCTIGVPFEHYDL